MRKGSVRVDLSKLLRKAAKPIASMLNELEDRNAGGSAHRGWSARFIAVGGKRATSRH